MKKSSTIVARYAVTTLVLAVALAARSAGAQVEAVFTFDDVTRNGNVTSSVKDIFGGPHLRAVTAVLKGDTATVKRNKVFDDLMADKTANGIPWGIEKVGANELRVTGIPNVGVATALHTGRTGEKRDSVIKRKSEKPKMASILFDNPAFVRLDDDGGMATFTAGVITDQDYYLVELLADDPRLLGSLSGEALASTLATQLLSFVPASVASINYSPGTSAIDFLFPQTLSPIDHGVFFGTTSISEGVVGSIRVVPEPADSMAFVLLVLPMVAHALRWAACPRGIA